METNLRIGLQKFGNTPAGLPLLTTFRALRGAANELASCWLDGYWNTFIPSCLVPNTMRRAAYRGHRGLHMTRSTTIEAGCFFSHDCDVSFEERCIVNRRVQFIGPGPIRIGAGCGLGFETMLCTVTHEMGPPAERAAGFVCRGIVIGAGCWVGARVTILPGVTIGEGCIIDAGSVVVGDCAANGMYGGVPARRISDL